MKEANCPRAKNTEDSRETSKRPKQKKSNKGKSSTHAAAASAIGTELNKRISRLQIFGYFRNLFRGNSVNISWTDGPTTAEVEKITGRYKYGHFNGMENIYRVGNTNDNIPQVRFVSETFRTISQPIRDKATELIKNMFVDELKHYELERYVNIAITLAVQYHQTRKLKVCS